jgi:hypothetical protein
MSMLNLLRGFLVIAGLLLSAILVRWIWVALEIAWSMKIVGSVLGVWIIAVLLSLLGEHATRFLEK